MTLDFFTCDVDTSELSVQNDLSDMSKMSDFAKKLHRLKLRNKKELKEMAHEGVFRMSDLFFKDQDLFIMTKKFTDVFHSP